MRNMARRRKHSLFSAACWSGQQRSKNKPIKSFLICSLFEGTSKSSAWPDSSFATISKVQLSLQKKKKFQHRQPTSTAYPRPPPPFRRPPPPFSYSSSPLPFSSSLPLLPLLSNIYSWWQIRLFQLRASQCQLQQTFAHNKVLDAFQAGRRLFYLELILGLYW